MRLLNALLAACVALLVLLSGCTGDKAVTDAAAPTKTRSANLTDAGTGSTLADAAFRSVGTPDDEWIADASRKEYERQLGDAIQSALAGDGNKATPVSSLKMRVRNHADARVIAWEFSDSSLLQYHFLVDLNGARMRLTAVSVVRF